MTKGKRKKAGKKAGKKDGRYHHGDLRPAMLEAAANLIAERGISGLSLRECARRLGVSHAAPYRHFPDKASLLGGLAQQGFEWLAQAGRAAMEGIDDPAQRLDAYGVAYVRFAVEHPEHHRVMFTSDLSSISHAEPPPDNGAFDLLLSSTREVVGEGADELTAAVAFWSLVHGLSMLIIDGRIPDEHISTPEAIDELTRQTLGFWKSDSAFHD